MCHVDKHDGYYPFLFIVGVALLWLNLMDMPTLNDDMIYRFMWQADEKSEVIPIRHFDDLIRSQWTHYLSTNGRTLVHLLFQAFQAFTPPFVLQVLDTLLFVLLIHLVTSWLTRLNAAQRLLAAVMACTLLFIVFQGFRTAMLWGLGALNYLWTLVAVMVLLSWLRHIHDQHIRAVHYLLSPLALLAGWGHEALSLPVAAAFCAWFFVNRNRLRESAVPPYLLWFFAGTALCLLSPGIWGRATEDNGLQNRLLSGAINLACNVRVSWMLGLAIIIQWKRDRMQLRTHFKNHFYEYVALITALTIVVFCGANLERVAFFSDFIAMLLLLGLCLDKINAKWGKRLILTGCTLMFMAYVPASMVRRENYENWHLAELQMQEPGRELIAVRQPVKGECPMMDYFREHYANSSIIFGYYSCYRGFDASDINIRCAAKLYNKPRLVFLPEDVVQRIISDPTAFRQYELDRNGELYVWQMDDERQVKGITFQLRDEDPSTLSPLQRLVAWKSNEYELDEFNYERIDIDGRPFLVFTRPTTNIFRRIENIVINK